MTSSLDRIIRAQHGVITRGQAIQAGITRDAVQSRVRHGAWQPLHRGVYLTTAGPPRRDPRLWAAVLYCGNGAILSHETAAELHGLTVRPSSVIHVTIPGS